MLHAVHSRKTQFHHRYLGHRDGTERKVHEEDEIVSIIFGGLELMAPKESYEFLKKLVGENQTDLMPPDQAPTQIEYEFWPQWKNNGNRLEPDLFITLKWSSESSKPTTCTYLLFEFKWRSPLGKNQLINQWQSVDIEKQERTLHVFLSQEPTESTLSVQDYTSAWKGGTRLFLINWREVLKVTQGLKIDSTPLRRWSELVCSFLENIGIRSFTGFNFLIENPGLPTKLPDVIFYPIPH